MKKSDVKRFYNYLADDRGLQAATIDNIHTVLHQVLDMAVDDDYIRANPSNNVLKELKQSHCFQTEKRRGLTQPEQDLLLDFLRRNHTYSHWYPIFAVMLGTGLRVGEVTGLRWCDIDLEEGIIDVNHTLINYSHRDESYKTGCYKQYLGIIQATKRDLQEYNPVKHPSAAEIMAELSEVWRAPFPRENEQKLPHKLWTSSELQNSRFMRRTV